VTAAGIDGYIEVYSGEAGALKNVTATLEIAGDANAPTLSSAPIELVATKSASRRVGQAEVGLSDLPPGEYVARAVVSVGGKPVGRLVRSFGFAPSAEVRARSAGGAASLSLLRPRFDPKSVLQGDVLERMLKPVAQSSPTGAVAAAMSEVAKGDLAKIPDTLRAAGDDVAPTALLRGIGLYARGELEPAAAEFRRALRADSELSSAAFYLGACYAAGGRDREAVGAWQTTLAAEQLDPVVFALATEAYLRLKDWPGALDVAREAAGAWPDDALVQRQLLRAEALGGRRADALTHIDAYVAAHPSDHEVAMLGMKLLYDAAADGRPISTPRDDLARFDRYLSACRAAKGPEVALAERWRQVVAAGLTA
jgi:tetratricopeptide (TPR) repeat protein